VIDKANLFVLGLVFSEFMGGWVPVWVRHRFDQGSFWVRCGFVGAKFGFVSGWASFVLLKIGGFVVYFQGCGGSAEAVASGTGQGIHQAHYVLWRLELNH
jgi:hypothetical protein